MIAAVVDHADVVESDVFGNVLLSFLPDHLFYHLPLLLYLPSLFNKLNDRGVLGDKLDPSFRPFVIDAIFYQKILQIFNWAFIMIDRLTHFVSEGIPEA